MHIFVWVHYIFQNIYIHSILFKYVSSVDDKYLKTGNADLSFYLINMREDYIFGYFSGGQYEL